MACQGVTGQRHELVVSRVSSKNPIAGMWRGRKDQVWLARLESRTRTHEADELRQDVDVPDWITTAELYAMVPVLSVILIVLRRKSESAVPVQHRPWLRLRLRLRRTCQPQYFG